MGIVNITPDSSTDGGQFFSSQAAINRAMHLFNSGADWVDLGAESTRPGAVPVSTDEEWARLEAVVTQLCENGYGPRLSIDTQHAVNSDAYM